MFKETIPVSCEYLDKNKILTREQGFLTERDGFKRKYILRSYSYYDENTLFLSVVASRFGEDESPYYNQITLTWDKADKSIRFGPKGDILMEDKGVGIGTSLISTLIEDLKSNKAFDEQNFIIAKVNPLTLTSSDASNYGPGNMERRSRFYSKLNLEVTVDEYGNGFVNGTGEDLVKICRVQLVHDTKIVPIDELHALVEPSNTIA